MKVLYCLLVVWLVVNAAAPAQAQAPTPPPFTGTIIDPDAKAQFSWSVPERYAQSWATWNPRTASYAESYVNPAGWSVILNGCLSSARFKIERYTFTVTGLGFNWTRTIDGKACQYQLTHALPQLGLYRVTLVVRTGAGDSVAFQRIIKIKDWLIVSLGDSMASGEGNPDTPGIYELDHHLIKRPLVVSAKVKRAAIWKDTRCHRSALAGHALVAQQLEQNDAQSSVTFLSFACSGAEVKHLVDTPYGGRVSSPGPVQLPSQLRALEQALRGTRRIHALLLSIGINDLGFSTIAEACAKNFNPTSGSRCVETPAFLKSLVGLSTTYDELGSRLRESQLDIGEIYISDYPVRVFRSGGCGALGTLGVGITAGDGGLMETYGFQLNNEIRKAARRNHWNFVQSLETQFAMHAYCDNPSYFVKYETSWEYQGDKNGTAHPNREGHAQIGRLFRGAVVLKDAFSPYRHVKITIVAVKLRAMRTSETQVRVSFFEQNTDKGNPLILTVPQSGKWVQVAEGALAYEWDVFPEPAPPRFPTKVAFSVVAFGGTVSARHTLADAYGSGTHEIEHPAKALAIRYRVEITKRLDSSDPPVNR
jgi:hypothetical protein